MLSQVETYTNKKLVVKTVTFHNTDLNSKYYYIHVNEDFLLKYKYDEDNTTDDRKAQQKAFNEWLEEGIKQEQVTKLMDYYKTIADKK